MASTTTSQGATNFTNYWPTMIPSEDNSGFNSPNVNSSTTNQSLTNCQQAAASFDYGHSAYSTGSTGYPGSYYSVGSGSHHHYGSVGSTSAGATLYQQLTSGSLTSMGNNNTTAQAPSYYYYVPTAEDNSGFGASGLSNSSVNPMANCSQGGLEYAYNPYNQASPWYANYYANQGYGSSSASSLYPLAHIPPSSTTATPMGSLLTTSGSWEGSIDQDIKSITTASSSASPSSKQHLPSSSSSSSSASNVNNTNNNDNNNNSSVNNSTTTSTITTTTSNSNATSNSSNSNHIETNNSSNGNTSNVANGNVNNSNSSTINTVNSGGGGGGATNSNNTNSSSNNCVNSNSNSNSSNTTNSNSIGNSSKKHCAHYLNENPTTLHYPSLQHLPLDTNQMITTTPKPTVELITSQSNPSKKGSSKAGRGRGRRQPTQSPDQLPNHLERVFIWDLDETIIIYNSLLTGSFASKAGKDTDTLTQLGLLIEQMMLSLADIHFFFNDLEHCDQIHIDDVSSDDNGEDLSKYNFSTDGFNEATRSTSMGCLPSAGTRSGIDWMRKLAFRYRRIKEIYDQYRTNVSALLGNKAADWMHVRNQIENLTDNWLNFAIKCLTIINDRPDCVNVLVTDTQLVPALCKLLLHRLGPFFPVDNIYSSAKVGKETCLNKIKERFGNCSYVVIGDSQYEKSSAKKSLGFPYWPVNDHADLVNLHHALEHFV
ncbi:eyes absent homolog 3-like isoform X2 [Panonychus citri]|uniref:eyes absent homolog 3-like isoform X2 n=1 Tax=Panonychus citri TaxID=50023 RepID=UPI002308272A|nr:eyes absent homolog 3-like isoform X2 [Panonychus citri]